MSEVKGKVVQILDVESGVSKGGKEWSNHSFVIETDGQYPKKVYLTAVGKSMEYVGNLQEGDDVTVQFNPESSEYNGRWFTKLQAYSIKTEKKSILTKEQKDLVGKVVDKFGLKQTNEDDDLPF